MSVTLQEEQIYNISYTVEQIYDDTSLSREEFEEQRDQLFQDNFEFLTSINQVSNKKEFLSLMFTLFRLAVFNFRYKNWDKTIITTQQIIYLKNIVKNLV